MDYTAAQEDVRCTQGISRSGAQLIEAWEVFIDECASGYSWDIAEYRNELRVRNDIEAIVSSERLRQYEEHERFIAAVQALDERFKALGHPAWRFSERTEWWERLVLERAGRNFADYCRQVYGFQMDDGGGDHG